MEAKRYVSTLMENARKAQEAFEAYDQAQVDRVVRAVGKAVYDHGEELAHLAVDETQMGTYDSKTRKNKNKAMQLWYYLRDKKSVGPIRYHDNGVVEVAKPLGVIGAITPITNPIITPLHNAMIALKGRNAIVICPHPRTKGCVAKTVEYINQYLAALGAPENLVQMVAEPTMEITALVLQMADVNIATGGAGMVKAVYSSGKPSFGVGAGNNQCLIGEDADLELSVPQIIFSRTTDNGILCTGEQTLICMDSIFVKTIAAFEKSGCVYFSDPAEVDAVRRTLFPEGALNRTLIGRSPCEIAEQAGLSVPEDTKLLLIKCDTYGAAELLSREKLFPVMVVYRVNSWQEGVSIAKANLEVEGMGHSACLHTFDKNNCEYAAEQLNVGRLLVNGSGAAGLGGAYTNGLVPTATLGCGSWGNNSLSANLDYIHMINITHIAYSQPSRRIPTPEEIWG